MYYPDENTYLNYAKEFSLVPVSVEWPSDTETPITIYSKVALGESSFLLESVEGAESIGRYSFIGLNPEAVLHTHRDTATIERGGSKTHIKGNPLNIIEDFIDEYKSPVLDGMPRFYCGAVGYIGYDLVRHIERLPDLKREDQGVPDSILMVPGTVIIIDHLKHTMRIVVNTRPSLGGKEEFQRASRTINHILKKIREGNSPGGLSPSTGKNERKMVSSLSKEEFMERVKLAKEYIMAGDILQVVLSRRIDMKFNGDPFRVYRRLRRNNPSPYLYYLDTGSVTVAGSSPEMLVRVEGETIETRPIAGTRPRGLNMKEDQSLAGDLLSDVKERAEHVMLVDLGRNDIGRISRPGTVKVEQFMEVEKYSHVMHLVSSVKGQLKSGIRGMDVLRACFPAGTVSGAPKVRAMEIIEELEPSRRGPYAGSVGYIGFNGNMDTAIAIRTIVFHNGVASVQVGAGIVADSDPASEFQETENKAMALLKTLAEEDDQVAANY
ncbi:MAG: anthranilate synthase component I [Bacillota bacterium]